MEIIRVMEKGIFYRNGKDQEHFIDFQECNKNWLAYRKRTENLSDQEVQDLKRKDKTIGRRETEPTYFMEFFAKPFTKFQFSEMENYRKTRDLIWQYGWNTIDLN